MPSPRKNPEVHLAPKRAEIVAERIGGGERSPEGAAANLLEEEIVVSEEASPERFQMQDRATEKQHSKRERGTQSLGDRRPYPIAHRWRTCPRWWGWCSWMGPRTDRKSTRLNSSQ